MLNYELLEQKLTKLCLSAIQLAKAYPNSKTFYLQTHIDKSLVAKLEEPEQTPIEKFMALKNLLNQKALEIFKKNSDLVLDQQDPQLLISLDLSNDKLTLKHSNVYIYFNYLKKSREYAQHIWACSSCKGKGCQKCNFKKEKYPSVESVLREVFIKEFKASDVILHSSGREDVDVLTLGNGRPAVLEIVSPLLEPEKIDLNKICLKIKENYPIELLEPRFVKKFWVEAICTSHFNKEYLAVVYCQKRALELSDFEKLKSKLPICLHQRTPLRVLKRRSDIVRKRYILDLTLEKILDGKLVIRIYAEAGTYIKEFVSGDEGRTKPSISSILELPCICQELTLIKVDDFFVKTLKL
ncbi:MAG: tRNA pseudouridine(54/55) synthase Pus10 [Candidatus Micrarchaeota archaeon]|nr:tRNA pseudouridine(54/55) synthase Pus10 [Candidatus Micrarchaeota archaeon]